MAAGPAFGGPPEYENRTMTAGVVLAVSPR